MRLTRIAGALGLALLVSFWATSSYSRFGPFGVGGSAASGGGGGSVHLSADLTVVNDGGSTIGNGYARWAPFFADGDIAAGTDVIVKDNSGNVLPHSVGLRTFWPSGTLRQEEILVCKIPSTAAGGSQTLQLWSGGTVPSASARSLTEVYNQQFSTSFPISAGITDTDGRSGTYVTTLANDANNIEKYKYLSGGCGEEWRFLLHLTKSGTADGQLEQYVYLTALDDGLGNAAGFFEFDRTTQPWYNHDTPAKAIVAFDQPTWSVNPGGGGTVTTNFAALPAVKTFTASGANITLAGALPNPYYFGESSGLQVLPGYLTTTGTLPTGLSANTLYSSMTNSGRTSMVVSLSTRVNGTGAGITTSSAGTGTHTFHPVYVSVTFGGINNVRADSQSNFFQGTGSLAADPRLRVKVNQTYLVASKNVLPYCLPGSTCNGTALGTIRTYCAIQFPEFCNGSMPFDYNYASIGVLNQNRGATGDSDVGWLSTYDVRHFITQSKSDDTVIRQIGLAEVHNSYNMRDFTTRQYINPMNTTYTGMPAPSTLQQSIRLGTYACFAGSPCPTFPDATTVPLTFSANDASHIPEMGGYAYWVTGESYYADMIAEQAIGSLMAENSSLSGCGALGCRAPRYPVQAYGLVTAYMGQERAGAWILRNLTIAGLSLPLTMPDGSAFGQMIQDILAANYSWVANQQIPNLGSYPVSTGFQMQSAFGAGPSIVTISQIVPFSRRYMTLTALWGVQAFANADAITWMKNRVTDLDHFCRVAGTGFSCYGNAIHNSPDFTNNFIGTVPISSDNQYGTSADAVLTWNNCSAPCSAWTITMGVAISGWTPSSGDVVVWDKYMCGGGADSSCDSKPGGGGFPSQAVYTFRDVASVGGGAYTLNLTTGASSNPAIAPPSDSGTIFGGGVSSYYRPQASSITSTARPYAGGTTSYSMLGHIEQGVIKGLGITGLDNTTTINAVYNDSANRLGTVDWSADGANGGTLRYAIQP